MYGIITIHKFLFKGTIAVMNTVAQGQANDFVNKKVIFRNCAPFTNCIIRTSNTQVDDVHYIPVDDAHDTVIPMYNLIKFSDNYSKTCGISWQWYNC